jgi:hypothetical protein
MPLVDVLGKAGTVPPEQMVNVVPKAKVGVITGLTVTAKVTGGAQGSDEGVNVYVPLVVLLTTAGLHTPVIPLVDVLGKAGAGSPSQIEALAPKVNVGVITGCTVTVKVAGGAQGLDELVNV